MKTAPCINKLSESYLASHIRVPAWIITISSIAPLIQMLIVHWLKRGLVPAWLLAAVLGLCLAAPAAAWTLQGGVAYSRHSGVRDYLPPWMEITNLTSSRTVPWVRLGYEFNETFGVGVGYTAYRNLRHTGFSPHFPVTDDGSIVLPVIVENSLSENIDRFTFDFRYRLQLADETRVFVEPSASLVRSRAKLHRGLDFDLDNMVRFSDTKLRGGLGVGLEQRLSARWSGEAGVFYFDPPGGRTIRDFRFMLGYHF
ncbi:MAG: porin family protein [Puniceicoccaceae bacterium]|nr:MAG: porin family protein [Puniceicoccaceae bacterium]